MFDRMFGQILEQIFGKGFDQGFGEGRNQKYSTILRCLKKKQ